MRSRIAAMSRTSPARRSGPALATFTCMHPDAARLAFREMSPDDLDDMASLLGDPEVMTYYPRPQTRQEAMQWIDSNRSPYQTHGYRLWLRSRGHAACS